MPHLGHLLPILCLIYPKFYQKSISSSSLILRIQPNLLFSWKLFTLKCMTIFTVLLSAIAGFAILQYVTHPTKSKIRRKMPDIKTKGVQIFPIWRIWYDDKIIHFHHWFNFALLLLISAFITSPFLDSSIIRGFLLGGVLQGLTLKDGRNLRGKFNPICNCHHCQLLKNSRSL
jgi:hypothetical protein